MKLMLARNTANVESVPSGWEFKQLGELLRVRHGKSQRAVVAEDGAYPILGTSGEIGRTNMFLYDRPSVLIGRKGTIDSPQFMDTPFWTIDTLFYTEISACADPKFVFYLCSTIDWLRYNEASGVPSLNASTIEGIEVKCPPLSEQRAIASLLSDVDVLLTSLDRLIAKKCGIKQAAMQQLLTGQCRLPGFASTSARKQSDLGTIPADWDVVPLGALLREARLGGNYPNTLEEYGPPLMKMGNVGRGSIDISKIEYVAPGVQPNPLDRLARGDLLFNTRNTLDLVGKVAIWRDELPLAFYNSNLMRLTFEQSQVPSNEYANYALNSERTLGRLRAMATGTTSVAAIYVRDLRTCPFLLPPNAEQVAIAAVLSDMDAEIALLEQRRDKTRAIKQGMIQELLTGRRRLV